MANLQAEGEQHLSEIIDEIKKQLAQLEYGSLEIQVHNGQVVQIERREKRRWEKTPSAR
ncbi:YezD family protein [Cellvibrio fontiphilus]|uniref:YezD family protein n=1 Tax=Cellvibrio fontiphilus TaxID=1815559 RepID=A0ABV7FEJ0_9GAMM